MAPAFNSLQESNPGLFLELLLEAAFQLGALDDMMQRR